ncbi:MAG: universal stress protein [Streptosporangiales bacterium]|nr:universal stress protein [Streptosporangiales bacterium]
MSAPTGVIVGYDGSTHAVRALDWALEEAELRACPLVLCHVWRERSGDPAPAAARRTAAVHMLDHGARCAADRARGVPVRTLLLEGSPAGRLRGLSARAELLVVGSHGLGALARLTAALAVGSVSQRVAADSRCPVIVVRGAGGPRHANASPRLDDTPPPPPGATLPLVVGVSAAPGSRAALGFAAEEARMRGRALHLVHACRPGETEIGRDLLDAAAASPGMEGLTVRSSLVVASVRSALLAESRAGALLVVGAPRGRGGPHLPYGSALRGLLHEAPGPMAVVRPLNV